MPLLQKKTSFNRGIQNSDVGFSVKAIFWGPRKAVEPTKLEPSLGDFSLTESGFEVFTFWAFNICWGLIIKFIALMSFPCFLIYDREIPIILINPESYQFVWFHLSRRFHRMSGMLAVLMLQGQRNLIHFLPMVFFQA